MHGIYRYLYIIVYPVTLTTLCQCFRHFYTLSSINNNTETLQPVITALIMRQKSVC